MKPDRISLMSLAAVAMSGVLHPAVYGSQAVTAASPRRIRLRDEEREDAKRREIREWNEAIERRKAEKRARRAANRSPDN
jgi:hypothetical protein